MWSSRTGRQAVCESPVRQPEQSLIKLMKPDKITAQGGIAGGCLTGNRVPVAAARASGICLLKPVMTLSWPLSLEHVNVSPSCSPASRVQEEPPPKRSTGCICLQMRSSSSSSAGGCPILAFSGWSPEQANADQDSALPALHVQRPLQLGCCVCPQNNQAL